MWLIIFLWFQHSWDDFNLKIVPFQRLCMLLFCNLQTAWNDNQFIPNEEVPQDLISDNQHPQRSCC